MTPNKFFILLLLSFIAGLSSAQSWQYANSFGGQYGSSTSTPSGNNNQPFNLVVDENGNSYLYGTYGNLMELADSTLPYFTDDTRGTFIAKFNCSGEVDWLKSIAHSEQMNNQSDYMIMKDGFLYLTGTVSIDNYYETWFLDTLVIGSVLYLNYPDECIFPWVPFNNYTYIIKLDMDGNIIDYHLLSLYNDYISKTNLIVNLWQNPANQRPFTIDNDGNFYLFTRLNVGQSSVVFCDNESITDTIESLISQAPYYILKFNSNFNLLWHKPIVNEVTNNNLYYLYMDFIDIQVDSNNNLYITGYAKTEDTASINQYPTYIDLGYGNMIETYENDYSVGFILKLDSDGESVWVRQTKQFSDETYGSSSIFESVILDESNGSLYITGKTSPLVNWLPETGTIFGTNDTIINDEIDFAAALTGFIAKYDIDGNYYWVRIPETGAGYLSSAGLYENNLYCSVRWDYQFWHDTEFYETDLGTEGFALCSWDTEGNPNWSLNIPSTCSPGDYDLMGYDTRVNNFGEIITTGTYDYGLTFGEHEIYGEGFKMFIAKYGNPCPIITNETETFCFGDEYNGSILTESGDYQFILESSTPDVDSVVNLHATVHSQLTTGINDTTFCKDEIYLLEANTGYNTYEWSTGSETNTEELTYSDIGTENVYVTLTDDYCTGVDTIVITIEVCGFSEQQVANSLNLYPVPANSHVTIQLSNNQIIEAYSVFNLQGKLIKSENISSESSFTITTNELPAGQYLIYVKTNAGVYTGGFVKE